MTTNTISTTRPLKTDHCSPWCEDHFFDTRADDVGFCQSKERQLANGEGILLVGRGCSVPGTPADETGGIFLQEQFGGALDAQPMDHETAKAVHEEFMAFAKAAQDSADAFAAAVKEVWG